MHHTTLHKVDIDAIKRDYRFDAYDEKLLKEISSTVLAYEEELIESFYDHIFRFKHASAFIQNEKQRIKHEKAIRRWFQELFGGTYDEAYFDKLYRISEVHVQIALPSHYVNSTFSFLRGFLERKLSRTLSEEALLAVHKILDINLDILSLSYFEEGRKQLIEDVILIKEAIKDNLVIPYVQAIVSLQNENEPPKYECLMRLFQKDDNTYRSIFPLLKTAKRLKLYPKLMKQMTAKSLEAFRRLPYAFSLNLSYEDIADESFIAFLMAQLQDYPHPERITFEILETEFVFDFSIVLHFIETVRHIGCKIAIDDFGSGYSNLENVLKFKPDYLKIDGSLIKEIAVSEHTFSIVRNIVDLTKELDIKTVAEYVHNEEVYKTVKALGIDYAQGFYINKPFAASELTAD